MHKVTPPAPEQYEVEVKVIDVDEKVVTGKLLTMGAERTFHGTLVTTLFDTPERSLARQRSHLRLRTRGGGAYLTYKRRLHSVETKTAEELECLVGDSETLHTILSRLGLEPTKRYEKRRTSYRLDDLLFEFDELPGIPVFMEVEAASYERMQPFLFSLGIDEEQVKCWDYAELIAHYAAQGRHAREAYEGRV